MNKSGHIRNSKINSDLYVKIEERLNFRTLLSRTDKICTFKDVATGAVTIYGGCKHENDKQK